MLPCFSLNNRAYCGTGNVKTFCNIFNKHSVFSKISYVKNLFFIKFCRMTSFSVYIDCSTFFNFIGHIVLMSSKEKVFRPNTPWIVAFMANIKGFIKRSVMQFVTKSVSKANFGTPLTCSKVTITTSFSTYPFPAFVKWNDCYVFPKSNFWRQKLSLFFHKGETYNLTLGGVS